MKNTMTRQLTVAFTLMMLMLLLCTSIGFYVLFFQSTLKSTESRLQERAESIAQTISYMESHPTGGQGKRAVSSGNNSNDRRGNSYLTVLNQLMTSDFWIIDAGTRDIYVGQGRQQIDRHALNDQAESLVDDVLTGNVVQGRELSGVLGEASISAGAPVFDTEGQVVFAVILHEHVSGIRHIALQAMLVYLVAAAAVMLLSGGLFMWLLQRFSKPMHRIASVTDAYRVGDYEERTHLSFHNEVGRLAQNIDVLGDTLAQAKKERETIEENRRYFIAAVSHELKTPVTVMRGYIEAISDGIVTDPKEQRQYMQKVLNESKTLERMINDLLELTRLQNPDYVVHKKTTNVIQVLQDAVGLERIQADEKDIQLRLTAHCATYWYQADAGRLRQLFMIILDNAVRYAPPGSAVEINSAVQQDRCIVTVRDHGPGMSEETKQHVFERFFRGQTDIKGTGLGLSIAAEIAARHNINIRIDSALNEGTQVSFIFPESEGRRSETDLFTG